MTDNPRLALSLVQFRWADCTAGCSRLNSSNWLSVVKLDMMKISAEDDTDDHACWRSVASDDGNGNFTGPDTDASEGATVHSGNQTDVHSKVYSSLYNGDFGLIDPHVERWACCGLSIGVLMVASMASFVLIVACLPVAAGTRGLQSIHSSVPMNPGNHPLALIGPDHDRESTCRLPSAVYYYTDHMIWHGEMNMRVMANVTVPIDANCTDIVHSWCHPSIAPHAAADLSDTCAVPYSPTGVVQPLSCAATDSKQNNQPLSETPAPAVARTVTRPAHTPHSKSTGRAVLESAAVGLGVMVMLVAGLPTWLQYV